MQFRMFHSEMSGISYPLLNIPDDWEAPALIKCLDNYASMDDVDRLESALQRGLWHATASTLEGVNGLIWVSQRCYDPANFPILLRTAKILLEAGTDLNACTTNGNTPLILNIASVQTKAADLHYSLVMANLLLQNGASVDLLHSLHATYECYLRPLFHANPGALLEELIVEPSDMEIAIGRGGRPAQRRYSTLDRLTSAVKDFHQITPVKETLTVLLFASGALL
jgi:hypothetical protein